MLYDLKGDAWLLAYTMSNISEVAWAAGWMQNLEYVLWHAVAEGPREWGRTLIDEEDIKALKILSARTGGWIYYDDEQEETYIPLTTWQSMFAQAIQDDPNILW